MSKKLLMLIVGSILILGGVGVFIYYKTASTASGTPTTSTFKSFFPFGLGNISGTTAGDNTNTNTEGGDTTDGSNSDGTISKDSLKQVTTYGITGANSFMVMKATQTGDTNTATQNASAIKFIEKSNGRIHQIFIEDGQSLEIDNSAIPNTYEALFSSAGDSVIYRYLDDTGKNIQSFLSVIGMPSGQYLPENIVSISSSSTSSSFFYITKDENNNAVGNLFTPVGSKNVKVFKSPFSEWNTDFSGAENVYLTTKPSYNVEGSVYSLNTRTGIFTKILSGIKGLTTKANQDNTRMIYSSNEGSGPKLYVYNMQSHEAKDTGLYSFADKCVFAFNKIDAYCAIPNTSPKIQNPDLWYQGLESYSDSIYKVNTNTGTISLIINTNVKGDIDATDLFLDKTENNLFFTNKKDSTLWNLNLK